MNITMMMMVGMMMMIITHFVYIFIYLVEYDSLYIKVVILLKCSGQGRARQSGSRLPIER